MNRSIFGYGLWLVLAVSPALGSPLISIDEQYMLNTDAQRRIPILVSSPTHERVEGVNLAVQIGDGGAVNGGANTAPRIINLDLIGPGTIFNASNTGSTPQYVSLSGNPPYLIATADTTTITTVPPPPVPNDLEANGVLAWLTVNPAGATVGSAYQVKLQNVGANDVDGPWNTDFTTVSAAFSPIASIHIVNLHTTTWNAGNSGAWTDTTWTDPQPPFPNYTAQAIVNTSYTVNVASAQEANSLALSGGGKVAISSTGSLAITNSVSVSAGGVLSIAPGSGLSASGIQLAGGTLTGSGTLAPTVTLSGGGTLDTPGGSDNLMLSFAAGGTGGLSKTGSGTATLLNNATYAGDTSIAAGRLQVNGLSSTLHSVSGAGALVVGDGATASILTADSINIGTLTLGIGSRVVIAPLPGGPQAGSTSLTTVPEPSTIILLIAAGLGMLFYCKKIK